MATPLEIRKKSSAAVERAEAIQAAADGEHREITADEEKVIVEALAESKRLLAQADMTQKILNQRAAHGYRPTGDSIDLSSIEKNHPSTPDSRWGGGARPSADVHPVGGKRYAEMFALTAMDRGGFESFGEYLKTLHSGLADQRLGELQAAMVGGTGSAGGYLVPQEFAARMLDASLENEIVRPRCMVEPMMSDSKKIAGFANNNNSSSLLFGGFSGQWLPEGGAATEQDAKVRVIQLNAKKLAIFTAASNELVADGQDFESTLAAALVQAIGWHLDMAALTGTGAGMPLGVLNDPALITITKESSQVAATIVAENVVKMFARLHPALVDGAVWVANSTAIPQLYLMRNLIKNVAGTENVGGSSFFIPGGMIGGKPSQTLLGLPVLFTEKLPVVGTKGDLVLANFSQYSIGLRQEIVIEKSSDAGWSNDLTRYRVKLRADGMGRWSAAFTPKNGSTLSWCVALETRS